MWTCYIARRETDAGTRLFSGVGSGASGTTAGTQQTLGLWQRTALEAQLVSARWHYQLHALWPMQGANTCMRPASTAERAAGVAESCGMSVVVQLNSPAQRSPGADWRHVCLHTAACAGWSTGQQPASHANQYTILAFPGLCTLPQTGRPRRLRQPLQLQQHRNIAGFWIR